MSIGQRIKEAREHKNLTQANMAEKLGIGRSTYANYEQDTREPSLDILIKFSKITGLDLHFLITGEFKYLTLEEFLGEKEYKTVPLTKDLYLIENVEPLSDAYKYKVKSICMCDKCRKKGMPELILEKIGEGGEFYVPVSDLFTGEYLLAVGSIENFNDLHFVPEGKEGHKVELLGEDPYKISHNEIANFIKNETDLTWLGELNQLISARMYYVKRCNQYDNAVSTIDLVRGIEGSAGSSNG